MRIVSQDGRFDLPYELVAISTHAINRGQVIAKPLTNADRLFCVMGEYSTEEKAEKAMGAEDGIQWLQSSERQNVLFRLRLSQSISISAG